MKLDKKGSKLLVLWYWFIYIFDVKNYKNYFLITEIQYDNIFYSNEFIY